MALGIDTEPRLEKKVLYKTDSVDTFPAQAEKIGGALPRRVNIDPDAVERGLTKLVMTLIELLRQLLERQAIRRIDAGSLSDEQIEKMGQTFIKLKERMEELKGIFGLENEDLNLHLGPLGNLL